MSHPSYFLFQGVVHVGVNYRLGALGFLALEGEAGGNQGLRDQVSEALDEIKLDDRIWPCLGCTRTSEPLVVTRIK